MPKHVKYILPDGQVMKVPAILTTDDEYIIVNLPNGQRVIAHRDPKTKTVGESYSYRLIKEVMRTDTEPALRVLATDRGYTVRQALTFLAREIRRARYWMKRAFPRCPRCGSYGATLAPRMNQRCTYVWHRGDR